MFKSKRVKELEKKLEKYSKISNLDDEYERLSKRVKEIKDKELWSVEVNYKVYPISADRFIIENGIVKFQNWHDGYTLSSGYYETVATFPSNSIVYKNGNLVIQ